MALSALAGWWRRWWHRAPEPPGPLDLIGKFPCPRCGELTTWSPPPPTPPGATTPHLRCEHCHQIIG